MKYQSRWKWQLCLRVASRGDMSSIFHETGSCDLWDPLYCTYAQWHRKKAGGRRSVANAQRRVVTCGLNKWGSPLKAGHRRWLLSRSSPQECTHLCQRHNHQTTYHKTYSTPSIPGLGKIVAPPSTSPSTHGTMQLPGFSNLQYTSIFQQWMSNVQLTGDRVKKVP